MSLLVVEKHLPCTIIYISGPTNSVIMHDIEVKLRTLISDEASFNVLKLILELMLRAQESKIAYSQEKIVNTARTSEAQQYNKLKSLIIRFDGLCELISNNVIADNLMGNTDRIIRSNMAKFKKELLDIEPNGDQSIQLIYKALKNNASNPYEDNISLMHLNTLSKTHILDVSSYFQQMFSYFVGIHPFDLFSFNDKVQVGNSVNQAVLADKLDTLGEGSYIKFMTFSRGLLGFSGHAMVIKKTGNTFSFFDPNAGEQFDLNLLSLCEQINKAMRGFGNHKPTHMAFLDGNKFIQHVNGLYQTDIIQRDKVGIKQEVEEQHLTNEEMSTFILSELEKIVKQGQCSDEDLVNAMDTLRTKVERFMQTAEQTATETHETTHLMESHRYTRDTQGAKLEQFETIRFALKEAFWRDLVQSHYDIRMITNDSEPKQGVLYLKDLGKDGLHLQCTVMHNNRKVCKTNQISVKELSDLGISVPFPAHSLIKQLKPKIADILNIRSKQSLDTIQEHDLLLDIINIDLPFEKLESRYDFGVLLNILNVQNCQILCDLQHEQLASTIKTPRDINVLFNYLKKNQASNTGELKCDMVYNAIKTKLHEMIQSAYDIKVLLKVLSPEQRFEFLDEKMLCCLPDMINSAGDLADVFHYLSLEQRIILFDKIKDRLVDIIQNSNNSGYEFKLALAVLSPEQRAIFFDEIKEKLPFLHVEDLAVYNDLLHYLDRESSVLFEMSMKDKIPDLMAKDLKANITSVAEFILKLTQQSTEADRAFVFDTMEEKLPDLIINSLPLENALANNAFVNSAEVMDNIVKILKYLPPAQYAKFASNDTVQQCFKKMLLNSNFPSSAAESFSKALLSNDDERIKTEFDHMDDSLRNMWVKSGLYSYKNTLLGWLVGVASLDPFWLSKINDSLKLSYSKQFYPKGFDSDFHLRLCEYCDSRLASRSQSSQEIKAALQDLKQEPESNGNLKIR